jgi:hypothetical protein
MIVPNPYPGVPENREQDAMSRECNIQADIPMK